MNFSPSAALGALAGMVQPVIIGLAVSVPSDPALMETLPYSARPSLGVGQVDLRRQRDVL